MAQRGQFVWYLQNTTTLVKTPKMPVYDNGALIYGTEPQMALPVNLITYTAKAENNRVKIEWSTSSKLNNSHFDVERSETGIAFTKMGTVNGKGNSSTEQKYRLYDEAPVNGYNYYRLKQYNTDGKMTYLGVRLVKFNLMDQPKITVSPNPTSEGIYVNLSNCPAQEITITLTGMGGAVIYKEAVKTPSGLSNYRLGLKQKLSGGQYMLQLKGNGLDEVRKIIVLPD